MRAQSRVALYRRLARRNLESLLRHKFLNEYGYDKGQVVAAAIVDDICATVRTYYSRPGDLEPGQLIYPAPAATERGGRGRTMARTKMVPVVLTVVASEDIEAIRSCESMMAIRHQRIRRLSVEAYRQGALLSQADVAILTGYSTKSVGLVVKRLREAGEHLPLRGYIADMGSFPTHKAAVIDMYLRGLTTPDIAARTYHSKEAVDRYIGAFERVRLLAPKFATEELPLLTGMSPRLIEQYLRLLDDHGIHPKRSISKARRVAP